MDESENIKKEAAGATYLILASASPRRRELLGRLNVPYTCEVPDVDEIVPPGISPEDTAEYLSGLKAEDISRRHAGETVTVIGADTIVLLNGKIYGKPVSKEDAYRMLKELSGRVHEVRTGVTVISGGIRFSFTETAMVEFHELTDSDIETYIATGEPLDKAGAYGVQGQGCLLVKGINGDYYTVVGLPVSRLNRELKKAGLI